MSEVPSATDLGQANLVDNARRCSCRHPVTRRHLRGTVYVCHCAVVTDRDVIESVANGARCVRDVALQTGAGRICGGCISTVRELVCQSCSITADRVEEVAGAAC